MDFGHLNSIKMPQRRRVGTLRRWLQLREMIVLDGNDLISDRRSCGGQSRPRGDADDRHAAYLRSSGLICMLADKWKERASDLHRCRCDCCCCDDTVPRVSGWPDDFGSAVVVAAAERLTADRRRLATAAASREVIAWRWRNIKVNSPPWTFQTTLDSEMAATLQLDRLTSWSICKWTNQRRPQRKWQLWSGPPDEQSSRTATGLFLNFGPAKKASTDTIRWPRQGAAHSPLGGACAAICHFHLFFAEFSSIRPTFNWFLIWSNKSWSPRGRNLNRSGTDGGERAVGSAAAPSLPPQMSL